MKAIQLLILLRPCFLCAQHTLTVTVTEVKSAEGYIALALYNSEVSWLKEKAFFKGVFVEAQKNETVVVFNDIPEGDYAITLFHDENGDKELDKNIFGIPKEPLGFSIGKLKTFGPPSFEECSFKMTSDFQIKIPVN